MTAPDHTLAARLEPCHFCATECTEIADVSLAETRQTFQVQCIACGFSGPCAPSEDDAVKLWNSIRSNHTAAVAKAVEACAVIADAKAADMRKFKPGGLGPLGGVVGVATDIAAAIRARKGDVL